MIWPKINIKNLQGCEVTAYAPYILSASRATDIPAFYAEKFFTDFNRGYFEKRNPFNNKTEYISTANVKFIVFWTKYAAPILPYLNFLDDKKIGFYFQFTLNDYEKVNAEKNLPGLQNRIKSFIDISDKFGKDSVVWRFDPVLFTPELTIELLLERIDYIARQITGKTDKLVFSFLTNYRKVQIRFSKNNFIVREPDITEKRWFVKLLSEKMERYNINCFTCSDPDDYTEFNVAGNKCIDNNLIEKRMYNDTDLREFLLQKKLKDSGQRKDCNCIFSKDIGTYNTCNFNCLYCYANR